MKCLPKCPYQKKKVASRGGISFFAEIYTLTHATTQAPKEKALKFFKMLVGFEVVYRMMV